MRAISCGYKVVTMQAFQPELFLSSIREHKVTDLPLVPPVVLFLANDGRVQSYDLSSVQRASSAAAPLGPDVINKVVTKLGIRQIAQGNIHYQS